MSEKILPTFDQMRIASYSDDRCVHTEHCCIVHGCKYDDDYCPVAKGHKTQSMKCESCGLEEEGYWE